MTLINKKLNKDTTERKSLKTEYISHSAIKNRKWTDMLIRKFLSDPDKLVPNPY